MEKRLIREVDSLDAALRLRGNLDNCVVQGLDLREAGLDWKNLSMRGAVFLGCDFPYSVDAEHLLEQKALVFPKLEGLPYDPYRSSLYSREELVEGWSREHDGSTDRQIYDHFVEHGRYAPNILEALAQRIHDHAIDDALKDLLEGRVEPGGSKRVVGIMGGHSTRRDDPYYAKVVRVARDLTREGYFIASGGGPGIMEAANLGAYLEKASDEELDWVIQELSTAPTYKDCGYYEAADRVLTRFPDGSSSLAVPTWFYGHEPTNLFSAHVAKYFSNSLREDGLLAIALHGVIYAPGSAGTVQEVFMDLCQNHYTTFDWVSPMVFLGKERWGDKSRIFEAVKVLAADKAYGRKLALVEEADEAVAAILENPPERG